jgi:hypothetical protein
LILRDFEAATEDSGHTCAFQQRRSMSRVAGPGSDAVNAPYRRMRIPPTKGIELFSEPKTRLFGGRRGRAPGRSTV